MNSIRRKAILTLFTGALAALAAAAARKGLPRPQRLAPAGEAGDAAGEGGDVWVYGSEPELVPRVQRTGLPGLPLCPF